MSHVRARQVAARSVGAHAATPIARAHVVAIAERRDHVLALHLVAGREVGDRPRQAQRAVAAAGAELATAVGVEERALDVLGHADVPAQQPRVHVAVARRSRPVETLQLALAGRDHAGALGLRGRGRLLREALGVGALDVDEEVDAVEQRAAQAPRVAGEVAFAAATAPRGRVPARTRVRGGDEQEARREDRRALAAHDGHAAVLQRLAQRLERGARELGQLVEEEHAVMGEARLAGYRDRAAADQAGGGDQVMRRAERALGHQPAAATLSGHAVDARHLDRLRPRQRRQDRGQAAREHRLAHAGRPREQQVVRAGGGDGQRLDDVGVAADVGEVEVAHGEREHVLVAVGRRRALAAAEDLGHLREAAGAEHVQPIDERGLERPLARDDEAGRAPRARLPPPPPARRGTGASRPRARARRRPRSARAPRAGCGRRRRGSRTRWRGRSPGRPCASTPARG